MSARAVRVLRSGPGAAAGEERTVTQKSALMVWGGWEGHVPDEAAALFAPWLEEQGYDVEVSDT